MPEGKLVAMPFTIEVNDMPLYVRYGNEPEAFTRIFERFIAGVRHIPRPTSCLDITVHAHVFGRPAGAVAFRETLEIARRHEDVVWLTDHAELAAITAAG
jgi:hypothetical protein